MNNPDHILESLDNIFFGGLKYLNSLMRIRDGDSSDPGWKKLGSGINIPDPQHCLIQTTTTVPTMNSMNSELATRENKYADKILYNSIGYIC
jgi:hypothetical protein